MAELTAIVTAPLGDVYVPGCLDHMVGQEVEVKGVAGDGVTGVLLSYRVPDSSMVELTLEVP
jgi:hypothetical protein